MAEKVEVWKKAKAFRMDLALTPLDSTVEKQEVQEDDEMRKKKAIEDILSRSSLNLELVPMEDEEEEEEEPRPTQRKTVFKLPDD